MSILSVTRAQEQRIFNGYIFALLSQNVSPSQTILSEVIRCGGGKLLQSLPSVKALKMVKKLRDEDPRSCKPGNLEPANFLIRKFSLFVIDFRIECQGLIIKSKDNHFIF